VGRKRVCVVPLEINLLPSQMMVMMMNFLKNFIDHINVLLQACDVPSRNEYSHYKCDENGDLKCLPGESGF